MYKRTASRQVFWVSIARIFLVEVLVLIALSASIVGYLNWSSEAAWSDFLAASKLQSNSAIHAVRDQPLCDRSA
jgi:hypothetical protein